VWYYRETGSGRPLVLLHGIGMSHTAWNAVIPYLSSRRRVIAFDIAGFGQTPPLPAGTPPTPANLVDALEQSIHESGLEVPLDLAGNSLGGYLALEAARRDLARTVVAISPAGLWQKDPPPHVKYVFGALRFMAQHFPAASRGAMRMPLLRELLLAVPISAGSRRMPVSDAIGAVDSLAAATAFEETFDATHAPFSGRGISVPVTVAFGDRDWILTKRSRSRHGLPAHTQWIEKRGWGLVPWWVDPVGVSELILEGTASNRHRGASSTSSTAPSQPVAPSLCVRVSSIN
jgi:pimeloyl-ACP methyl ester carboxylesterase